MGISQSSRIIQMIGQVIDEPLQTSSHKPQPQKLNQTKKLQQKLAFNGLENREYLKNTCIRKGKKKLYLLSDDATELPGHRRNTEGKMEAG